MLVLAPEPLLSIQEPVLNWRLEWMIRLLLWALKNWGSTTIDFSFFPAQSLQNCSSWWWPVSKSLLNQQSDMKWGLHPWHRAQWRGTRLQVLLHGLQASAKLFFTLGCMWPLPVLPFCHMLGFRCHRIVLWHRTQVVLLKTIPLWGDPGPPVAPPMPQRSGGGSFWMMWPPKRLSPVLQGCSSSLITSTAYASCVRSKANSKLVLAVSHTNVVLTISVPSSLFPPSPWTTKLIRVIFFYLNTVVE